MATSENKIDQPFVSDTDQDFTPSDLERIEKATEKKYKVYGYRYFNLVVYIFGMFQISIMQNSFAPQANELTTVYNQSTLVYNLTSLLHMIMHVPVSFPANYIVDKYGTKVGTVISCIFCLIAAWIRCLVNYNFAYAIVGQLLVGCANPFQINLINKVSSNWFYPSQRAAVTALLSFFSTVTGAVGLVIPGIFFNGYKAKDDEPDYKQGKEKMFHLLLITAIIVTCTSCLNLLFYRDKPRTPPSYSANVAREDFKKSLGILIRKKTYVIIAVVFSLVYGCFISFAVVLGLLIGPYQFDSMDTSILSQICVGSGILGSIVIIGILKKTSAYKKLSIFSILGSIVSVVMMIFLLQTEIFGILAISAVVLGFFIIPTIPIFLELANEVCFPIGEATVTGFIYTVAHIVSFLLGSLFSVIIDESSSKRMGSIYVLITFISILAISLFSVFFMKQDLRRTKAEKEQADRQSSDTIDDQYTNNEGRNKVSESNKSSTRSD